MGRPRFSLAGKISALFAVTLLLMAAAAALVASRIDSPALVFLVTLGVGLPFGMWLLGRFLAPVRRVLSSLADGILSFRDNDFSMRLASGRSDEIGDLARLYNEVGETLHRERKAVRERELLLQSALDRSPAAILLVNHIDRIIYANHEARRLLVSGESLKGRSITEILEHCPPGMRAVLMAGDDGLFSVEEDGQRETYHLSRRSFTVNQRARELYLLRRLTAELGRQEAEIWKKVIRVIAHELNNSLAPISSLARSAQLVAREPEHADTLEQIFTSIRQTTDRLSQFLQGYAAFARLPKPRKRPVSWEEFLDGVRALHSFEVIGDLPATPGYFDPSHMQQVLTNLLRNAEEATDGTACPAIRVEPGVDGGAVVQVLDRGRGIPEEVMRKALLPFYSTKKEGGGLGLPLCREIIEAHGGSVRIQNRVGGGTIVSFSLPPR